MNNYLDDVADALLVLTYGAAVVCAAFAAIAGSI